MKIIYIFILLLSYQSFAKDLRFALVTPRYTEDIFWEPLSNLADKAAKDLGIKLDTFYAERNHFKQLEIIEKLMMEKYDGVITLNYKFQGIKAAKLADKYKVPLIFVTGSVDHRDAGSPRENYKYWIGEIIPNDVKAGIALLDKLVDDAKTKLKVNRPLKILAIEGNIADLGSIKRKEGLIQRTGERKDSILMQIISANWLKAMAKSKFKILVKSRYSDIDVVWCASDGMAMGVIEGAKDLDLIPGKNIFIGGVDWTEGAFEKVESGELSTTVGGHIFQGAWAVIALYDFLMGVKEVQKGISIKTDMINIPRDKIDLYREVIYGNKVSKINFSSFSLSKNKKLKKYNFSLNKLLK